MIFGKNKQRAQDRRLHNEKKDLEYVVHRTPTDYGGYFRNSDIAALRNRRIPAVLAKGVAHAEQGARDAEAQTSLTEHNPGIYQEQAQQGFGVC